METIKTAIVVVLLLAVLYGVYVVLNKPQLEPPPEVTWGEGAIEAPQVDIGGPSALGTPPSMTPTETAVPAPPALGILPPATEPISEPPDPVAGQADTAPTEPPAPATAESSAQPPTAPTATPEPPPVDAVADESGATATAIEPIIPAQNAVADSATDDAAQEPQTSIYESYANASPSSDVNSPSDVGQRNGSFSQPPVETFQSAWNSATAQLEKRQWAEALLTLSLRYNDQNLEGEQRRRLIDLLDPLAGKVIYSSESILEAPYSIRTGETLYDVAMQFQVPVTLLQNINGISNPDAVPAGTSIKIVRGPFRAEVNVDRSELVLFLGKYYAGRFAISAGNDPSPQSGDFEVVAKQPGREFTVADGRRIAARAADNPYGDWWIDLGGNMSLHGSPETVPSHGSFGCIATRPSEGGDVYGILSVGSKVTIR